MPDLYIDFGGLDRTRDAMRHMKGLLGEPLSAMGSNADAATGVEELRDKLKDFGGEWSYGIDKLADFTGGCADALDEIRSTFRELDDKLAAALTEGGGE